MHIWTVEEVAIFSELEVEETDYPMEEGIMVMVIALREEAVKISMDDVVVVVAECESL